jgi:LPXTG-motif cell wall-anchored protein
VPITTTTTNVVNSTTTSIPETETTTTLQPAVVSDQAAVEERPQELASTGFDSSMLIFLGILLVLVGVIMIVFCRNKKDD